MPSKPTDVHKLAVRTQQEVAELFGVSVRTVEGWRRHNPPMPGRSGEYRIGPIIRWLRQTIWAPRPAADPDDPDMGGELSPALERYRNLRADMVALQLAEKREQLVNRQTLREAMLPACRVLREGVERLQREHGAGAYELMTETLDEYERAMMQALGGDRD